MRLYGFWRSSATWRVRIALHYKGIGFEYTPVHLLANGGEQHRPEFRARNPMAHVPVLAIDSDSGTKHLAESLAILEWLEETHPDPPLLPSDSWLRARTRQLALVVVSGIQPLQNTKVQTWVREALHGDGEAWARHWVEPGLAALEELVRETAGTYCVGDQITFADVCAVPQLHVARRVGVNVASFPTLLAVERACVSQPAFQAAHPDVQVDAPKD